MIYIQIKALIAELDHECHKVLHDDMKPVEIALLVIIHQKHSDEITFNASHQSWTWNKKSFQDEYKTRLNYVTQKVKCIADMCVLNFVM